MKKIFIVFVLMITVLSGCAVSQPVVPTEISISDNSYFEVHYIDVGQADAALILCDGAAMLIDGGNVADSSLIAAYMKKLDIDYIDYVICTHAHEDHVGGLSGALSVAKAGAVYAPEIEADTKAYQNFRLKAGEQGLQIQHSTHGNSIALGSSTVQFLGPITENVDDLNNTSIVLKIMYGNTSFLFTGDAEHEEEQDIINAGYDLSADVMKVGHHGSDSSTSYVFLREVMPKYAIISVGTGNSYGHPTEEVLSRLRDADTEVYRTDLQGDIIVKSDGENISITTQKNAHAQTNPTAIAENQGYIGNINSKKFHRPDCNSLPAEKNRIYFSSRQEAVESGYSPCGNCRP